MSVAASTFAASYVRRWDSFFRGEEGEGARARAATTANNNNGDNATSTTTKRHPAPLHPFLRLPRRALPDSAATSATTCRGGRPTRTSTASTTSLLGPGPKGHKSKTEAAAALQGHEDGGQERAAVPERRELFEAACEAQERVGAGAQERRFGCGSGGEAEVEAGSGRRRRRSEGEGEAAEA